MRAMLFLLAPALLAADFTATLLHVNDTHNRIDPTLIEGKPYGGMPRLATLIERHRRSDPNPIVLHAGDAFQGTFYFSVYEGLADLAFFNAMHLDAMAVGNHEFDNGPRALGEFARNAQFPVLSANLDVDSEPLLEGLIRRSTIVTRGRERIGIVGGITPDLPSISNPGPNVRIRDTAAALQAEIDALTKAGINKIILVTHIGYLEEQRLARTLRNVDVIVGGHSHTLLGSSTAPGFPASAGPYPTVVDNPDGGKTLVVQSWEGERVLGRIQVTFDGRGRVKKWSTTQPIIVDESIPEDPALKALARTLEKPLALQRDREIARAPQPLSYEQLAELIPDAMLAATAAQQPAVALLNAGGIRGTLAAGPITYGSAFTIQPFLNTLIVLEVTGAQLKQALEDIVEAGRTRALWVSRGSSYTIDIAQSFGNRIADVIIAGRPLDPQATYRVTTNSFVANGGDGVVTLKAATGYRYDTNLIDSDVFVRYLTEHSPVTVTLEQRVRRK